EDAEHGEPAEDTHLEDEREVGIVRRHTDLVAARPDLLTGVRVEALRPGPEEDLVHGCGTHHPDLLGERVTDRPICPGERGRVIPGAKDEYRDEEDADQERQRARGG